MESSLQNERVTSVGCLFLGLLSIAILLTLASLLSRADGEGEYFEGCIIDLVIVAPFWGAAAFMNSRYRGGSSLRALVFSTVAYVLLATLLLALNYAKYRVRDAVYKRPGTQGLSTSPSACSPGVSRGTNVTIMHVVLALESRPKTKRWPSLRTLHRAGERAAIVT